MTKSEYFSIRQMIELTGLSEFTIRGWENRYKAFSPQRSDTGRRQYQKKDVERALLIRELLKRGHKISHIASLSSQSLLSLFEAEEPNLSKYQLDGTHNKYVFQVLELMALQKWTQLSDLFKESQFKNVHDFVHTFALPLLKELSSQVISGYVSVAQEHVLSSLLKEKIYLLLSHLENSKKQVNKKSKIRFILSTPEGDYHDLGLLLAHLLIRYHGLVSLYLGPHSPIQDLTETALRFEASHLLIVSTVSVKEGAQDHLFKYVSEIQKRISPKAKVLVAGNQAQHFSAEQKSRLIKIDSFEHFEDFLKSL